MTKTRKTSNLLLVGLLIATSFVILTPSAAAHSCTAEEGTLQEDYCGTECTEGEDHDHTITHHHENGWGQDESHIHYHCESKDDGSNTPPPPPCQTPKILGICVIDWDNEAVEILCKAVEVSQRAEALLEITTIYDGLPSGLIGGPAPGSVIGTDGLC